MKSRKMDGRDEEDIIHQMIRQGTEEDSHDTDVYLNLGAGDILPLDNVNEDTGDHNDVNKSTDPIRELNMHV